MFSFLITLLSQKSVQAGAASPWVLIISLPPPVHPPTRPAGREEKEENEKGELGYRNTSQDGGIAQKHKRDTAQTSVSSFDSEHWEGTEQGAPRR